MLRVDDVADSFYTEKYLGLPSKHPLEYDNADLALKAANMNNRNFFLIYGTADTRVTSQHAVMLAKTLIDQNILFQQLVSLLLALPQGNLPCYKTTICQKY